MTVQPRTPSVAIAVLLLSASVLAPGGCGAAQPAGAGTAAARWTVVDTGQDRCYDLYGSAISPAPGQDYYGQDAQYAGAQPSYRDNGDGTISDLNTGLMWQKDPGAKVTFAAALVGATRCRLAGYSDWRLPSIKELYSLIDFRGRIGTSAADSIPFIDTHYFVFTYGDVTGERFIDSQFCSSTRYVSTTMFGNPTVFGVNFADGRIKGYPMNMPGGRQKLFYCLYVREGIGYGINDFVDNGDGTVTDRATGLMWQKADDGRKRNWREALDYAESLTLAGYDDWRLPNAKELQSIVDYKRSPATTGTAAIDPIFTCTPISNEVRQWDFGYYWSSTTHFDGPQGGAAACYVAFGRAMGCINGHWIDVHGAGAQRSDPKAGDPRAFPYGRGPQGDAIRIFNLVRAVRDAR